MTTPSGVLLPGSEPVVDEFIIIFIISGSSVCLCCVENIDVALSKMVLEKVSETQEGY